MTRAGSSEMHAALGYGPIKGSKAKDEISHRLGQDIVGGQFRGIVHHRVIAARGHAARADGEIHVSGLRNADEVALAGRAQDGERPVKWFHAIPPFLGRAGRALALLGSPVAPGRRNNDAIDAMR